MQSVFVASMHPFHGFPFELAFGFPRAEEFDDFRLEQSDDGFGQCVVAAVSDASDGHVDFRLGVGLACHAITGQKSEKWWAKRLECKSLTKGAPDLVVGFNLPCRILRAGVPVPSCPAQAYIGGGTLVLLTKANRIVSEPRQTHASRIQKGERSQNYNKLARDMWSIAAI